MVAAVVQVRNLYISGGNSQVLGYDWNNGSLYDSNCLGNNGQNGGLSYIAFNGSNNVQGSAVVVGWWGIARLCS